MIPTSDFNQTKTAKISRAAYLGALALCALTSTSVPSYADDLPKTEEVASTGKLTILNTLAYAPFNYIGKDQRPAGLVVEVAQAAADALGVKLDIVTTPFASIFPSIAAGRSKIAWSTFTATPERLKVVDFVTFLKSGIVLVVPSDKVGSFQSKTDVCGAKIAVYKGNSADLAADNLSADCVAVGKPKIDKLLYPTQQESIQAVLAGRAQGRLEDTTAALYYVDTTNKTMAVAPGEYLPLPLGVIVPKGDTKTAEMVQKVIQHLMDNGTYSKIFAKFNMTAAEIKTSEIITSAD